MEKYIREAAHQTEIPTNGQIVPMVSGFDLIKPDNVSAVSSILREQLVVAGDTPVMSKKRKARRPTGAEKARRRKKRIQASKFTPSRRVALWRGYIVDGEKHTKYITLSGEMIAKEDPKVWSLVRRDKAYLRSIGVTDRPEKSNINPDLVNPYCSMKHAAKPKDLRYWGIPHQICISYEEVGIRSLHDWQVECLQSPGILSEGRSMVYVAPTSGGKSLVAEILMLRSVLFRARRCLLILPYVSICNEKATQLSDIWSSAGIRVSAFFSDSECTWHPGVDVAICTIERANSLINKLIEESVLADQVGLVVIDELHILADEHRGYLLELIGLKIQLINKHRQSRIQVVGLSATLPNIEMVTDWLGGMLYRTTYRPVPLQFFIKVKSEVYGPDGAVTRSLPSPRPGDPDHVAELVLDVVSENQSVLVFCATKDWCEKVASHVAGFIPKSCGKYVTERGKLLESLKQSPGGLCRVLEKTIPAGIAYHHAGLTTQERNIIEHGYRQGSLSCLCATSTLAAGVNMPARRVIIRSLKSGRQILTAAKLRQMAGRAGRTGWDSMGEAYVLCKPNELTTARSLINSPLTPLTSALHGIRLAKSLLDCIVLSLVVSREDIELFMSCTLRYQEKDNRERYENEIIDILAHLSKRKFIEISIRKKNAVHQQETRGSFSQGNVKEQNGSGTSDQANSTHGESTGVSGADTAQKSAGSQQVENQRASKLWSDGCILAGTSLGEAAVFSSFSPMDSLEVFDALHRAHHKLHLDCDIHLVYLVTPVSMELEPDWDLFLKLYIRLDPRRRVVADAIGISEHFLQRAIMKRPQISGSRSILDPSKAPNADVMTKDGIILAHKRFWIAMILHDLLLEVPVHMVARRYDIPRGTIQSLQSSAGTFCGMVVNFCDRLRWWQMSALLSSLQLRLGSGVAAELLPLVAIDHVFSTRARLLYDAGFDEVQKIALADASLIEALLGKLHQFEGGQSELAQQQVLRKTAREIIKSAQRVVSHEIQQLHDQADVAGGSHGIHVPTDAQESQLGSRSVTFSIVSVGSAKSDHRSESASESSWQEAIEDDISSWLEDDDGNDYMEWKERDYFYDD